MEKKDLPLVYGAIHKVMSLVGFALKTGKNTHHKYNFASEADLIQAVRPAMVECGLIMLPSRKEIVEIDHGVKYTNCVLRAQYVLISVEDGSSVTVEAVASAMDSQDKYMSKAETQAEKYAIVQTFLLPRLMNDPDRSSSTNTNKGLDGFKRWCLKHGGFDEVKSFCIISGWGDPEKWEDSLRDRFQAKVNSGGLVFEK